MWAEFKICISNEEDELLKSEDRWFSQAMINCEDLKMYYATFDDLDRKVVLLKWQDDSTIIVYNTYKEVNSKLNNLINENSTTGS